MRLALFWVFRPSEIRASGDRIGETKDDSKKLDSAQSFRDCSTSHYIHKDGKGGRVLPINW